MFEKTGQCVSNMLTIVSSIVNIIDHLMSTRSFTLMMDYVFILYELQKVWEESGYGLGANLDLLTISYIWWTLSLPYKLWGVLDPGWGSPLGKFQNLTENYCPPRPTLSCRQECKGNIFFRSWAGRVTVFGRVQKFPWRAAPAQIWRPHSSYGGLIVRHLILHTYMFHIIRKVGTWKK